MPSKLHNHQGRSLAAVRHICETLKVISKTSYTASVFSKKMNSSLTDRFVEVPSLADTLPQQGTMVIVANVFSSLPVRQRCINWQRETVGIRDWNTAFSLFHHKINWTILYYRQTMPSRCEFRWLSSCGCWLFPDRPMIAARLLLQLDQHAVNERINWELLQANTVSLVDRRTNFLSPPQRLTVNVS